MVQVPTIEYALLIAEKSDPTDREAMIAADTLVSWGHLGLAERLLERLRPRPEYATQVNRLTAAAPVQTAPVTM